MDHLMPVRRLDLVIIKKKKEEKRRTCYLVDFVVPADRKLKIKEHEKKNRYLDLARELRKLRNMKVTVIPVVIGAPGKIPKGLERVLD